MILIPNYCPAYTADPHTDATCIFDYRGNPFGFDPTRGNGVLRSDYGLPWVYFVDKTPVYPHRMM